MKNIKSFVIIFSLFLVECSYMNAMDYETQKIMVLLTPWIERKELALQYMDEAIQSNSVKKVEETIQKIKVITIFNPETKIIDLQVGQLSDSIEYSLFMRWLDLANNTEEPQKKADSIAKNSSSWWCSLQ